MDTESSSGSSLSGSPTRARPPALRLTHVGIEPSSLVGKRLKRVSRSLSHPVLTLDFADNSTFQVLVDGYDPVHKGVPKQLEMSSLFNQFFSEASSYDLDLTVTDCALINLSDKAFHNDAVRDDKQQIWDQRHIGVAFKFDGLKSDDDSWHCVWAAMQEYERGCLVFRSYEDVYLDKLQRSPRKSRHHARRDCVSFK